MPHAPLPVSLTSRDDKLTLVWNDGITQEFSWEVLRENCPCATCRAKRDEPQQELPVITLQEAAPVKVTGMKPLGNYAYNIAFSDGHATGIYSLELLRDLGTVVTD